MGTLALWVTIAGLAVLVPLAVLLSVRTRRRRAAFGADHRTGHSDAPPQIEEAKGAWREVQTFRQGGGAP